MNRLQGKIAIITGGTSGIGLATSKIFKEQGATVITNARNADRASQTLSEHADLFSDVFVADVSKVNELRKLRHFKHFHC